MLMVPYLIRDERWDNMTADFSRMKDTATSLEVVSLEIAANIQQFN